MIRLANSPIALVNLGDNVNLTFQARVKGTHLPIEKPPKKIALERNNVMVILNPMEHFWTISFELWKDWTESADSFHVWQFVYEIP